MSSYFFAIRVARFASAIILFATVLAFTRTVARADTCAFFSSRTGSHITPASQVINEKGQPKSTVSQYCGRPASSIDPHLHAIGNNGRFYNLKDAVTAASTLSKLQQASVPAMAFAPPPPTPPPPDAWATVLQPQFQLLAKLVAGNSKPCADGSATCLGDLGSAITAAEGATPPPALTVPNFVVGSQSMGNDRQHPLFGATISTVITPPATAAPNPAPSLPANAGVAQAAPQYVSVTTLTLSAENQLYNALTVTQAFGIGTPISYSLKAEMGAAQENHAAYTFGPYTGSSLAFNQTQTQSGTFQFCPQVRIPLVSGLAFSVDASASCDGSANVAYDVNLQPNIGYVRFAPSFDLRLRGRVTASLIYIVQGTGEADVILASFDGGAGIIYGGFNEPSYGEMFALRPFAYYNAQALSVDVTVSLKTFYGATLGSRTFHVYNGLVLSPLNVDQTHWSVSRIARP